MSKFYTASTQAKDFCDEAKATKEKSKELNNEVLLKKGELLDLWRSGISHQWPTQANDGHVLERSEERL